MISIVIRTKNEERWISSCLRAVFRQNCKDFEVILVDNESTDKTVEKASQFGLSKVLTIRDYKPGAALNLGVAESKGEFVVCLSGHCIPVDPMWLENLLRNFSDEGIAGVYGRQQPLSFTPDSDKRDLSIVFGLDKKIQRKDSFFHNANSMIRRTLWQKIPFDETVTNIEDRVWAQKVLQAGYAIVYEPEASVYHYHGIHQDGNVDRCRNVVRILEGLTSESNPQSIDIENLNLVALIPVRGDIQYINGKPLLGYTIERALESRYIKRTIVSTDNTEIAKLAEELGAEAPFLRSPTLSEDYVDIGSVLQYSLEQIEQLKIFPDLIVSLEVTFPFRPRDLLNEMIVRLLQNGFDSVVAAKPENRAIWREHDGSIVQVDEGLMPRRFKDPTFIELRGLACVTHPEFLREGNLLGERVGIYEVHNPYSGLEVRTEEDLQMASLLIRECFSS